MSNRPFLSAALPWGLLAIFSAIPFVISNPYVLHILIHIGIFVIGAMSLNLLLGYAGQLSLGHIALFGIGADTSALTTLGFTLEIADGIAFTVGPQPVWFGFIAAVVVSGVFGWIIGKLSFKVRGAYFVVVTVSFAEVVRLVALNWVSLTQGPMALNNIPPFSLEIAGMIDIAARTKMHNYYVVLAVGAACFLLMHRLVRSRYGRAIVALRESEALAQSIGINVTQLLVVASVVSAGMAGSAGSLYAHYMKVVDPDIFLFIYTVTMLIMVIAGGKGTLVGPIVGGILFGGLPSLLRESSGPELQWIVYGGLMILIVFLLPDGIVLTLLRYANRQREKSPPAAAGDPLPALAGALKLKGRS